MTKKEKIYISLGILSVVLLTGITIGITLVSKKGKTTSWSKRGVVIRFDR